MPISSRLVRLINLYHKLCMVIKVVLANLGGAGVAANLISKLCGHLGERKNNDSEKNTNL